VRAVYACNPEWLPAWLRDRIASGELEEPRTGEPLGRGWRRLLEQELAFLGDKDADVAATGIPHPNPASGGSYCGSGGGGSSGGGGGGGAAAAPAAAAAAAPGSPTVMPQAPVASGTAAARRAQQQRQAQQAKQAPRPEPPAVATVDAWERGLELCGRVAAGDADAGVAGLDAIAAATSPLQGRASGGLDLIDSSDLDAIMMAEGPGCGAMVIAPAHLDADAGAAIGAGAGAMLDGGSHDGVLISQLPDAGAAAAAPGHAGTWWAQGAGAGVPSLAAAAAAAAAGLAPVAVAGLCDSPALSRDSSFCGSVGSTGATPTLSRLRLTSNSPALPPVAAPLPTGAFGADGCLDGAAPFAAAGVPGLQLPRGYAPMLLPQAPSYSSEHSSGSALHLHLAPPAAAYGSPTISTEMPGGALLYPQPQPQAGLQQAPAAPMAVPVAVPAPQQTRSACTSPFGSPHVQSGGAFGSWGAPAPLRGAVREGSAPPALGVPMPGPSQPALSRFAADARKAGARQAEQPRPAAPQAEGPTPFETSFAPAAHAASFSQHQAAHHAEAQPHLPQAAVQQAPHLYQQQQHHHHHHMAYRASVDGLVLAAHVPMRQSAAGCEGRQQRESCSPGEGDAAPTLAAERAFTSCCGSVGSGDIAAASGAAGVAAAARCSSGDAAGGVCAGPPAGGMLLGAAGLYPAYTAAAGAAAAAAPGCGRLLSGARSTELAAAISDFVHGAGIDGAALDGP
jgi:hypothetical protein